MGLAAAQWSTDAKELVAADGKIRDPRGNRSRRGIPARRFEHVIVWHDQRGNLPRPE